MSDAYTPKIGVLLSFANEEDPEAPGNLAQLPPELVDIDQIFEDAEGCQVVLKPGLTYKRLIAAVDQVEHLHIFHYSGHATSDGLWLVDEKGGYTKSYVKGVVALLEARGVKLAFLNGCSTQEQVRFFHKAGIPVVISTHYPVADTTARHFASYFYRALVKGKSIQASFNEAEKALLSLPPDKRYEEDRGFELGEVEEKDHPYDLHIARGQEEIAEEGLTIWCADLKEELLTRSSMQGGPTRIETAELTPISYLQCDRRKEIDAFEERVDTCVQARCAGEAHQPLVVLIRGPKEEMPQSLASRYFEYTLDEAYGLHERKIRRKRRVPIYFPTSDELAEEDKETSLMLVEKPFRKEFNLPRRGQLKREDILAKAGKKLDFLMIQHDLEAGVSENLAPVCIAYIRRHWLTPLGPSFPQVLIVFNLPFEKATLWGRLGRTHSQLNKCLEDLKDGIPNLLLLPPLEPISKMDVTNWQRKFMENDSLWIDELFGKKKRLPMKTIQQKLQSLTQNRLSPS